jgi:O-antigen ligase
MNPLNEFTACGSASASDGMAWESGHTCGLLEPGESLGNGIWPRPFVFWMAAFYLALFIIRPWEQLLPSLGAIHFERIYALAMLAAVAATCGFRLRFDPQTTAVCLFLLCLTASALTAWSSELAWETMYVLFTLVLFYVVLVSVIKTPYQLVFMIASYIVVMGVYLAKSQWEYFVYGQHRYDQGVIRLVGIESTFGGPNSLAAAIVVSLPMWLFLHRIRGDFTASWPPFWQKWFTRGLAGYLVLAVTSLALTNSRSGMLSFVLFVVFVGFRGRNLSRKLMYLILGGVLIIGIWFVLPAATQERLRTIWDPEAGPDNARASADGRKQGFWAGIAMFQQRPVTGVGIGNFAEYRYRYGDGLRMQAHNLVGQLLGEAGLVGACGFLLLIGTTLFNCRKTRLLASNGTDPIHRVLAALALASRDALILLLFEGSFGHNLYRYNWLWLAAFGLLAVEFAAAVVPSGDTIEQYLSDS